jgi:acyloxyacyl hydrolase
MKWWKWMVVLVCFATLFVFTLTAPNQTRVPRSEWALQELFRYIFNFETVGSNGGGIPCAGCTMVVGLIEQLSQVHQQTTDEVLEYICTWIPIDDVAAECEVLVRVFGPIITKLIDAGETPDRVCHQIMFCSDPTCVLYQPSKTKLTQKANIAIPESVLEFQRPKDLPGWVWPWELLAEHKPIFDSDGDLFSTTQTLRGYHWRGADCDDSDPNIYPGRRDTTYPDTVDHNCNGIYGHADNGTSWEELLCSKVPQYGSIILGDSGGAHFHIPSSWVTASEMSEDVYLDLIPIAENELDWPFMSSATGFKNSTWNGHPNGTVDSGTIRNWQANHCSFRDYQNIAVNGARSSSMMNQIIYSLARNKTDHPVFLAYALIGNDVCNGHAGTGSMTTPQEFYQNVMGALNLLEQWVAPGSHVIFVGLIDGRILYDTMGEKIHPIGAWNQNVRYRDFYDFLNCLQISPCWGWMNSNETARNITTERAFELNEVYKEIIANTTFKNFDMHYYDCPMREVIAKWTSMGGKVEDLIEPVDGFHPTQIANFLTTDVMWEKYRKDGILAPVNPFNDLIEKLFGNQGGYDPVG